MTEQRMETVYVRKNKKGSTVFVLALHASNQQAQEWCQLFEKEYPNWIAFWYSETKDDILHPDAQPYPKKDKFFNQFSWAKRMEALFNVSE